MTTEEAIKLYDTEWWKGLPPSIVAGFQLFEEKLCMPFGDFQIAMDTALDRPTWTHEYADPESLRKEFLRKNPQPSIEEIMDLLPEDRRAAIALLEEGSDGTD